MYERGWPLNAAMAAAAPPWARTLIDGASELYEAASGAVDTLVREMTEK